MKHSEVFLVIAGLALLLSLPIIAHAGGFSIWVVAKVFYGVGVIFFVFNK